MDFRPSIRVVPRSVPKRWRFPLWSSLKPLAQIASPSMPLWDGRFRVRPNPRPQRKEAADNYYAWTRAKVERIRGLLPDQAPAGRHSRAKRAADENVVVHVPDRCLPHRGIVKHIVWLSVSVKVGYYH